MSSREKLVAHPLLQQAGGGAYAFRLVNGVHQSAVECDAIVRSDESFGERSEYVGDAADAGCDQRLSGGGRFQDDIGEGFGA